MGSKDTCQVGPSYIHMHRHVKNSRMCLPSVCMCVCVCELAKLVLALIEFVNILVIASEHCIALQPELAVGWLAKLLNCCLAAVSQFYAPSRSHSPPPCAWQKLIN